MAIKDLIVQNNMTVTEFGVYGLLAKKNIEDNDKLCQNLQQIENRIVLNMENQLDKEQYTVCYLHSNNKRTRIARNQFKEIKVRDQIMDQYRENPAKR